MKIAGFRSRRVSVPVPYPVVSAVRAASNISFVLLDVMTDEGVTGIAYAQAFNRYGGTAIQECLKLLEEAVAGESMDDLHAIWRNMWRSIRLLGHQGLATFALSMVDIALWDIEAKRQNTSVCRLLGGSCQPVHAYCSDGMWLVAPGEAARQAEAFAGNGFVSMKMRLGRTDSAEDVQAVKEVRKAIGSSVRLMADVNQGWSVEHALAMGTKLEQYDLAWLEEPIEAEDEYGHTLLSSKLSIPIATGENLYGLRSTQRFLRAKAASVFTPDLQRIGGVTGWLQLQPEFGKSGAQYSLHLFPEVAVHLLSAAGADTMRGPSLEWMSWARPLFAEPLLCREGMVAVPDRPGFGMEWDEDYISNYIEA